MTLNFSKKKCLLLGVRLYMYKTEKGNVIVNVECVRVLKLAEVACFSLLSHQYL